MFYFPIYLGKKGSPLLCISIVFDLVNVFYCATGEVHVAYQRAKGDKKREGMEHKNSAASFSPAVASLYVNVEGLRPALEFRNPGKRYKMKKTMGPGGIRTHDLRIQRPMLCQLSVRCGCVPLPSRVY